MRALIVTLGLAVAVCGIVACSADSEESYATYQECFDQRFEKDMKTTVESIVSCCLDVPIGGVKPVCGNADADCINYLTVNLSQTDADITIQMQACTAYLLEKNKQ